MLNISVFGKGAMKTPDDILATRFGIKEEPLRAIDWSKPMRVENGFTLPQRNQKSSSSCTAQATGYYVQALNKIENNKDEVYSARHIYSQVVAPGGGAYIWKAMSIPLKPGVASQDSVPDGDSSEAIMTDGSLNAQAVIEAIADKYAQIPNKRNIDWLAQVLEDYHGFPTGFNGRNDMFLPDGTVTIPSTVDWGHAVYVCGHEMRNGKKCLVFKNTWTEKWGDNGYGYFPEEFIKDGPIFDAFVYADINDLDPSSIIMDEGRLNKLWQAVFKRPIDAAGLTFYKGRSFDTVIEDMLNSPEHRQYTPVFKAVKAIENAVPSGQF